MGGGGKRHGWASLAKQTNWEGKGPQRFCLTSQPAGETATVGEGCESVCGGGWPHLDVGFLKVWSFNVPQLCKS